MKPYGTLIIQDHYIGQFMLNDEETVLTMIRKEPLFVAGGDGLIQENEFEIDDDFSIDENLQAFIEQIEEMEGESGRTQERMEGE